MERQYRDFRRPHTVPVKVGDTFEVTIEAVGEKGDGLAKVSGFVIFVPGVKKDDHVTIKITRVLRSVAFAEVASGEAKENAAENGEAAEEPASEEESYAEEERSSDMEDM